MHGPRSEKHCFRNTVKLLKLYQTAATVCQYNFMLFLIFIGHGQAPLLTALRALQIIAKSFIYSFLLHPSTVVNELRVPLIIGFTLNSGKKKQ